MHCLLVLPETFLHGQSSPVRESLSDATIRAVADMIESRVREVVNYRTSVAQVRKSLRQTRERLDKIRRFSARTLYLEFVEISIFYSQLMRLKTTESLENIPPYSTPTEVNLDFLSTIIQGMKLTDPIFGIPTFRGVDQLLISEAF